MALAAFLALAACAPVTERPGVSPAAARAEARLQAELSIENVINHNERVARIGWPMLRDSVDLCRRRQAPLAGFLPLHKRMFNGVFRDVAESQFGLEDLPTVVFSIEGFPATRAGLEAGDVITAINGRALSRGARSMRQLFDEMERIGFGRTILQLGGPRPRTISFTPVAACDFSLRVVDNPMINAFADGQRVAITEGMMRFAGSDQELALVISHEIAHNLMDHIRKMYGNALMGTFIDGLISGALGIDTRGAASEAARRVFSPAFEAEADYVGLYLMARSGREIRGAQNFWRRMATVSPGSITLATSHPATPERFLAIGATVREIENKERRGQPLRPNLR
ncbi:MAG: M48 family metalloprotease [Proteobacteria bacterium]|nr:M48 family metalloprotease [Pseudomonadota bacterium]